MFVIFMDCFLFEVWNECLERQFQTVNIAYKSYRLVTCLQYTCPDILLHVQTRLQLTAFFPSFIDGVKVVVI
jgi:hypothetical protein